MDVVIVALDRCLGSALLGLADIFATANRAIAMTGRAEPPFRVVVASEDGRPVVDGFGRRFEVDAALGDVPRCAAAIVPGFTPDEAARPPLMGEYAAAAAWLRRQHGHGALVGGSCSGVFLLAEAGLIDNRKCTTTWWLHDLFTERYPKADVRRGAALSHDDRVTTAGGPISWIDVALHVIGALAGRDAARASADFTIVDTIPSTQAAYIPTGFALSDDPLLARAERFIRHAGSEGMTARLLARQLAVSERTLHRRIGAACGETPKDFIDRVRLEMAKVALETTSKPIKEVARAAGYLDEASFRRGFRKLHGMTPSSYRSRHNQRGCR